VYIQVIMSVRQIKAISPNYTPQQYMHKYNYMKYIHIIATYTYHINFKLNKKFF